MVGHERFAEVLMQSLLKLSAECYLWHEIQYILPPFQDFLCKLDVYFSLARSGHSVEHHRLACCKTLFDMPVCRLLCL